MSDVSRGRRRLHAVKTLLDEERGLLLKGSADALAALGRRRAAAIAGLDDVTDAAAQQLEDLIASVRAAAARNQRLLQAWLDGANAARKRMERTEGDAGVGAYRADGSRVAADAPRETVRKRA